MNIFKKGKILNFCHVRQSGYWSERLQALETGNPGDSQSYRWVPLNPNVDNPNSRIIQSHVETTSQSPQCSSACLIQSWCCLFGFSGTHLHFLFWTFLLITAGFCAISLGQENPGPKGPIASTTFLNHIYIYVCFCETRILLQEVNPSDIDVFRLSDCPPDCLLIRGFEVSFNNKDIFSGTAHPTKIATQIWGKVRGT